MLKELQISSKVEHTSLPPFCVRGVQVMSADWATVFGGGT